ncbi:SycD/LcrH family type III secretion system chaperone [Chitinasiproducens palmae]|uniref:Type III secretion low calcium response chaperone LcrH/SycD n=1 Tax=Chitinasiproducens palmae TaxID=1770053 RepID=A0A1H2PJ30_9BURK|nr:SycD/LcrH family type III secretion system chaperone [Chitinasiproducens palmae]SDV46289.1 type III secretion low calcium response chaperone LcrH/SycD [Chitinasiproducens palmae]
MNQPSDAKPPPGETEHEARAALIASLGGDAARRAMSGLSDETMEELYAFAYRFYQERKLSEAETFFRFLLMYDFANPDYPFGLAAVYQARQEYAKAVEFYGIAFAQSRDDYRAMLHAGQCYLSMGRVGRARRCFESVVAASTHHDVVTLARHYLAHLPAVAAGAEPSSPASSDPAATGAEGALLTTPRDHASQMPDTAAPPGWAPGGAARADSPAHDVSAAGGACGETVAATLPATALPLAANARGSGARASNSDTWGLAKAAMGAARVVARSA